MPLEFHDDAICLSGLLGTKLKSKIIHDYYELWWEITSGGPRVNYDYYTAIIEMNAGTGEIYIKESNESIMGSAGCALELKFNNQYVDNPNICVILVEEDEECINHLKNVINRKYPHADINEKIEDLDFTARDCVLIRNNVSEAIKTINDLSIRGRIIYFFDPLLSVDMEPLRETYEKRIKYPFVTGVEFIIFFFSSDWINGRDDFNPLPNNVDAKNWNEDERTVVRLLEDVYGDDEWHELILTTEQPQIRMINLIKEYQKRLFRLFRFVIPMPFAPKVNHLYHLIFCSNFRAGASIISRFYEKSTNNIWIPDNRVTYNKFRQLHKSDIIFPGGNKRPLEWKLLWNFIKNYNNGKFDILSRDVREIETNRILLQKSMKWLNDKRYIGKYASTQYRGRKVDRYELKWIEIEKNLKLKKPPPFKPLTSL